VRLAPRIGLNPNLEKAEHVLNFDEEDIHPRGWTMVLETAQVTRPGRVNVLQRSFHALG